MLVVVVAQTISGDFACKEGYSNVVSEKMVVNAATKKQTKATYNKKAKKAYRKFLKDVFVNGKYHNGWGKNVTQREYAITDLNNDGKLELILNTLPFYGTSQGCVVYTYYQGQVKEAGYAYNCEDYCYGFKKGNLIYNYLEGKQIDEKYSKLKNGKLVTVARHYTDEPWGGTQNFYEIKGKKVTRKKFEAFLKKKIGFKSKDDFIKNKDNYRKSYKVKKYKKPKK